MTIDKFSDLINHERTIVHALAEIAADLRTGNEPDLYKAVSNAAKRYDLWPPELYERTMALAHKAGLVLTTSNKVWDDRLALKRNGDKR